MSDKSTKKKRVACVVRLPTDVKAGIKMLATQNDMLVSDVQDEAIDEFLSAVANKKHRFCFATSKLDSATTVWLKPKDTERLKTVAKHKGHSLARVVLTALIVYVQDNDAI